MEKQNINYYNKSLSGARKTVQYSKSKLGQSGINIRGCEQKKERSRQWAEFHRKQTEEFNEALNRRRNLH